MNGKINGRDESSAISLDQRQRIARRAVRPKMAGAADQRSSGQPLCERDEPRRKTRGAINDHVGQLGEGVLLGRG